ncbi:hypothetical protein BC629DRAFT_699401 [Irpex lacteus]|nr:hypothetical protein BC629DRAFT_699401 [Irpex lacteus]
MSLFLASYVAVLAFCVAWVDLVSAQNVNVTFVNDFLSYLDSMSLTNFTELVAQVTNDGQTAFASTLSDPSSIKTLFVPNNDAFLDFSTNDTQFSSSVLLYHLAKGNWTLEQLNGPDNPIPTFLRGRGVVFLESNSPQVIIAGATASGFEILNQLSSTFVVETLQYEHLTVQVLNSVIQIPDLFNNTLSHSHFGEFAKLRSAAGNSSDLDTTPGMTVFVPQDLAFLNAQDQIAKQAPAALFDNHVIAGQTIWYPELGSAQYTSQSGLHYAFTQDPLTQKYTVTLNGVTANIVATDVLMANGVMHVLDGVLYNTTIPAPAAVPPPPQTAPSLPLASASPTTTANAAFSTPAASTGAHLSLGPILGIVVVGASLLFCSIVGFLVWRAKQRAKLGWHIHRQRRPSGFDLALGDREAQTFAPLAHERTSSGFKDWNHSDTALPLYSRPVINTSSVVSRAESFEMQEKPPISPPDAVVVRTYGNLHHDN